MTPTLLVAYKTTSDLVSKLAFFAVTVIAARALSTAEFGAFSVAWTFGWLLGLAADMGLQSHLARAIAREPDRAGAICRALLPLRLGTTAAAAVLVAVVAAGWMPEGRAVAFILIVLAQVCGSVIEFFNYFFRGLSRTDVESSVNLAHRLGVLLLVWLLLASGGGLYSLGIALFVPAAVALVFDAQLALSAPHSSAEGLALSARHSGAEGLALSAPHSSAEGLALSARHSGAEGLALSSHLGRDERGERMSWPAFRRDVLPIGAATVLSALYFRIDLFLVQQWVGDAGAGLYNAVFRLIEGLRLFPAAALAVAFPFLCRARDARMLRSLSIKLGALGLVFAAGVYLTAPAIIEVLYGPRYLAAEDAFRVLAFSLPLFFLNYALTNQLIAWNLQRAYAGMCGAALLLNVMANVLWIPAFGIVGAAWSTFATEVVLAGMCGVVLAQHRVPAAEPEPAYASSA